MTLFEKIWKDHVVKKISEETVIFYIDRHFIHEVTSPQAFESLRTKGVKVFRPELCTATVDHNVPTVNQHLPVEDSLSAYQIRTLLENCNENNIECYGMGHEKQGIVHVIGPELGRTIPGTTIVCGDSHTSTHGAFATIAFGIGTSQVEQVLASQCIVMKKPKTMRIDVSGKLDRFVTPKDIILFIISQIGAEGASQYFVEYTGNVIEEMTMEGRMTVCNMSIEMGARGGLVGVDETTISYLKQRINVSKETEKYWKSLVTTDADNAFDETFFFRAEDIQPMITVGTSPDTGVEIGLEISKAKHLSNEALNYMKFDGNDITTDQSVDYVFIGSCTNGRIEDLRSAAQMIQGRKVAKNVTAWVVPGSSSVKLQAEKEGIDLLFKNAGFEFREPGCSACLAMNDDKIPRGALCVSTSNRNFEGRQGEGARTILASPITAVACALTGKITSPKSL